MARGHTRGRFIRPSPRTKMWIGAGVGTVTLAGSSLQLISTLSAGALLLRPFTILRTRMLVTIATDQEAADESPIVTYGRLVVTDTAAALGVTALPDPSGISGDPESDWFVWQAMMNRYQFRSGIGATMVDTNYVVDSKAMRKIGPDDDVVALVATETSVGAFLMTNGRTLIQLH